MIVGAAFSGINTFINGFSQSLGMVDATVLFFVVYASVVLLSRLTVGRLQDHYGDNAVLYPALVAMGLGLLLVSWTPNPTVLWAGGILLGFGFGSMLPSIQAIIASKLSPQQTSIGISTSFIFMDMGFPCGPFILGLLVEHFGYQSMYATSGVIAFFGLLIYYLVHGRFHGRQEHPRGPRG